MIKGLAKYAKGIVYIVGAIATYTSTTLHGSHYAQLIPEVLTALLVILVPNYKPPTAPKQ